MSEQTAVQDAALEVAGSLGVAFPDVEEPRGRQRERPDERRDCARIRSGQCSPRASFPRRACSALPPTDSLHASPDGHGPISRSARRWPDGGRQRARQSRSRLARCSVAPDLHRYRHAGRIGRAGMDTVRQRIVGPVDRLDGPRLHPVQRRAGHAAGAYPGSGCDRGPAEHRRRGAHRRAGGGAGHVGARLELSREPAAGRHRGVHGRCGGLLRDPWPQQRHPPPTGRAAGTGVRQQRPHGVPSGESVSSDG